MKDINKMVFDGKYKEVEKLILRGKASLEELSPEAFEIFKAWIEKK